MAFGKKVQYSILSIFFLFTAAQVKAQPFARYIDMPPINCLDVKLPVTFSWINYDFPPEDAPAVISQKVKSIILDFYLESNGGDSSEIAKAKDYYFCTLRMPLNNLKLIIVILKTPLSYSHCKLFLYDSVNNSVSKTTVDYNTWAMYWIEEGTMKRSDLLKSFHIDLDDMALVQKKQSNLLLRRLKHNGTNNELEELTYHPNGLSLDTVSFKSKILEEPVDK